MTRALWSVSIVFLLLAASAVFAQNGTICLYADPQGTQCNITDNAPGVLSVYVIHTPPSGGATGTTFAAPKPDCMVGVTWITDASTLPLSFVDGNSQTGLTIAYHTCIAEPTQILAIQYMASGLSQADCAYDVIPALGHSYVEVIDCSFNLLEGVGGAAYVNSALSCQCSDEAGPPELSVQPLSLDFGAAQTELPLSIQNLGGGVLQWSVAVDQSWLSVDPTEGVNDGTVHVRISRSGLAEGSYAGNVEVSGAGAQKIIPVTMVVAPAPQLRVSPDVLTFTSTGTHGSFFIENTGSSPLQWTISADRTWISVSPASGSGNKWISVRVAAPGPAGPEDGHVTVVSNGGTASVLVRWIPTQDVGGTIGVFADPQAASCNVLDQSPGVITVYIVHVLTPGASASEFAAPLPACMTGVTYLGETGPFRVVIGNTQTGVTVGYGSCLSGPILLLTVYYMGQGASQSCCQYSVVADPHLPSGKIEVSGCDFTLHYGTGAHAIVNPTPACACGSVLVEDMTWGHIKAMYAPEE